MTNLLIKMFVKDYTNTSSPKVRSSYGSLSGIVGIIVNAILSAAKLIIGTVAGSISITGDALNNLSDAGSSAISLLGFRISSKPADEKHPYGHGRLEYLCGMAVGVIVIFMGYELIKSSIEKIINPVRPEFSIAAVIVLVLSMLGKLWLAFFNKKIGTAINSDTVDAVVKDSLSDMAATAASILALILSKFTAIPFDGIFGVAVSLFIFWAGIGVFRTTVASIIGQAPDPEVVQNLENMILAYDGVLGVHDMIVHDYGPGRCFITAHAEVSANADIMESHDLMDIIEKEIKNSTGYIVTLHMDPLIMDDEKTNSAKKTIEDIIAGIDKKLSIHDFRMVSGPHHTNLIFDLVIPFSTGLDSADVIERINTELHNINSNFFTVITVDQSYS